MSDLRPSLVILAGPNGAGKSTVAPALLHGALAVDEFINADVIARGLSAFDYYFSGCRRRNLPLTELLIGFGLGVTTFRRKPPDAGIGPVCATS